MAFYYLTKMYPFLQNLTWLTPRSTLVSYSILVQYNIIEYAAATSCTWIIFPFAFLITLKGCSEQEFWTMRSMGSGHTINKSKI